MREATGEVTGYLELKAMSEEQLDKLATNWVAFVIEFDIKASTIYKSGFVESNNEGFNRLKLISIGRLVPQVVIILLPNNKKAVFVVLKNTTAYAVRCDLRTMEAS